MKEYLIDQPAGIIKPASMSSYVWKTAQEGLVIPCHDIIIEYGKGAILLKKQILWPLGGAIRRGMSAEESLREMVREDCGLELDSIVELDCARISADQGADTINIRYFAKGRGELRLGPCKKAAVIPPHDYHVRAFREGLHPYVRDFMDMAVQLISR